MKEEIRERGKEGRKASVVAWEIEAERRRKSHKDKAHSLRPSFIRSSRHNQQVPRQRPPAVPSRDLSSTSQNRAPDNGRLALTGSEDDPEPAPPAVRIAGASHSRVIPTLEDDTKLTKAGVAVI